MAGSVSLEGVNSAALKGSPGCSSNVDGHDSSGEVGPMDILQATGFESGSEGGLIREGRDRLREVPIGTWFSADPPADPRQDMVQVKRV